MSKFLAYLTLQHARLPVHHQLHEFTKSYPSHLVMLSELSSSLSPPSQSSSSHISIFTSHPSYYMCPVWYVFIYLYCPLAVQLAILLLSGSIFTVYASDVLRLSDFDKSLYVVVTFFYSDFHQLPWCITNRWLPIRFIFTVSSIELIYSEVFYFTVFLPFLPYYSMIFI